MEKVYYSYDEFKDDIKYLTDKLDKNYDCLVGITRGGLLPLLALSHALNQKEIKTVKTDLYDFDRKKDAMNLQMETNFSKYQSILLIDDIADSGETLKQVVKAIQKQNPTLQIDTATIFYKKTSVFKPTYFVKEIEDKWIDFFWEVDFRNED